MGPVGAAPLFPSFTLTVQPVMTLGLLPPTSLLLFFPSHNPVFFFPFLLPSLVHFGDKIVKIVKIFLCCLSSIV